MSSQCSSDSSSARQVIGLVYETHKRRVEPTIDALLVMSNDSEPNPSNPAKPIETSGFGLSQWWPVEKNGNSSGASQKPKGVKGSGNEPWYRSLGLGSVAHQPGSDGSQISQVRTFLQLGLVAVTQCLCFVHMSLIHVLDGPRCSTACLPYGTPQYSASVSL